MEECAHTARMTLLPGKIKIFFGKSRDITPERKK